MKLGLKHGRGIAAVVTRSVLRSRWSHAVLLDGDTLMESTALKGRHPHAGVRSYVPTAKELSEYSWYPVPEHLRDQALIVFAALTGKPYDFFSLLSFLPPIEARDSRRFYCYELVAAMLGVPTRWRYTVEDILEHLLNETNAHPATITPTDT